MMLHVAPLSQAATEYLRFVGSVSALHERYDELGDPDYGLSAVRTLAISLEIFRPASNKSIFQRLHLTKMPP